MISFLLPCGILSKNFFLGKSLKRFRKRLPRITPASGNFKPRFFKNLTRFKSRISKDCGNTYNICSIFFKTWISNFYASILFFSLYFKIIDIWFKGLKALFNIIKEKRFSSSYKFLLTTTTSIINNSNSCNTNFFTSGGYLLSPASKELYKVPITNSTSSSLFYYKNISLFSILFLNFNNSIRSIPPRLYSLYPVNSSYFVNVSAFFPTLENVLKFTKIIFFNFKVKKEKVLLPLLDLKSSLIHTQQPNYITSLSLPLSTFSSKVFTKFKFVPTPIILIRRLNCQPWFFNFKNNKKFKNRNPYFFVRRHKYFRWLARRYNFKFFFSVWYMRKGINYRLKLLKNRVFFNVKQKRLFNSFKRIRRLSLDGLVYNTGSLYYLNKYKRSFWSKKESNTFLFSKNIFISNQFFLIKPIFFKKFLFLFLHYTNTFFLKNYLLFNNLSNLDLISCMFNQNIQLSNIIPNKFFRIKFSKLLVSNRINFFLKDNLVPWIYINIIKFVEFCSAKRACLQIYSFMNQSIEIDFIILYKRWIPRLSYYERRLGHRFFLEEALHIIHISFTLKDIKLLNGWLKAIIKRISFWKTRFIFRFLRYIFNNYFTFIIKFLGVKGFKVKLKGKISVAGNSRKRSILFRLGKTSHSVTKLRVIHHLSLVHTFTGVMGLQTWLYY